MSPLTEYGRRARILPAPPRVVWADLVAPRIEGSRPWLVLLPDEVPPRVLESEEPSRVVWTSLWTDRPDDQVVLDLSPTGDGGTSLRFTLLAAGEVPDEALAGHIRKRINVLLHAELRATYGQ